MNLLKITGGKPLYGRIRVSGAKNAALPLMAASLLTDQPVIFSNVPYLADITTLAQLLRQHGVSLQMNDADPPERIIQLQGDQIDNLTAPYEIVRTMRASVLVLGPLLARFGQAKVSLPGGCAIGTRPVDLHLKALEQMGAQIEIEAGYINAKAPEGGLKGADISFEKVSVGATENLLMAAALADGETILRNAACEPEIGDLVKLLTAMGAQIEGVDTATLRIKGVAKLGGAHHSILPDRIEAGTYLCLVGATGGDVTLERARAKDLRALIAKLTEAGLDIEEDGELIRVRHDGSALMPVSVTTQPHPGFPTDMQAQMMALLTQAQGTSHLRETIFENRYMHVPELVRMGADIRIDGQAASVHGKSALTGAEVMATDLRASVSLVIAALAAQGDTVVSRLYHLDRGYERLEEKLRPLGAQIERVSA
jgi:UDP-N-acetylglucosamine 1-carboxyvinyltransferase